MGRGGGGQFFEGGLGFSEIAIINFTSRLISDSLLTCRLKDVSVVIFHSSF